MCDISGLPSFVLLHPLSHIFAELHQFIDLAQVFEHVVPIDIQVFVHEDVSKSAQWSKPSSEFHGQHVNLTQPQQTLIVIGGAWRIFQRNNPIADVNTALGCHFQITLDNVSQVAIGQKLIGLAIAQRL